ncbi:MAG TPA: inositol monophosphatase [Opitutaceae bacterium]|nr:inositol monophosphatase [Opitutaceae bacterium]
MNADSPGLETIMTHPEISARIEAAQAAVLAQTELLQREFGRAKSEWKADGTRVTAVDLAISAGIVTELRGKFSGDDYFSEELVEADAPRAATRRFAWVLDPIDGTNNYALGIAHCAISLALLEHGRPIYGVIYDLARHRLMHGGPGLGAWDGERATRVRTGPLDAQSVIGFHTPYEKQYAPDAKVLVENFKIRALGSSTLHLAYVAAGILDGVVDHNVKVWDIAAAVPLCLAAGGSVEFLNGDPFPLRQFDLRMPRIRYVAGSAETCAALRRVLHAG